MLKKLAILSTSLLLVGCSPEINIITIPKGAKVSSEGIEKITPSKIRINKNKTYTIELKDYEKLEIIGSELLAKNQDVVTFNLVKKKYCVLPNNKVVEEKEYITYLPVINKDNVKVYFYQIFDNDNLVHEHKLSQGDIVRPLGRTSEEVKDFEGNMAPMIRISLEGKKRVSGWIHGSNVDFKEDYPSLFWFNKSNISSIYIGYQKQAVERLFKDLFYASFDKEGNSLINEDTLVERKNEAYRHFLADRGYKSTDRYKLYYGYVTGSYSEFEKRFLAYKYEINNHPLIGISRKKLVDWFGDIAAEGNIIYINTDEYISGDELLLKMQGDVLSSFELIKFFH